jgi:hypothetical protein
MVASTAFAEVVNSDVNFDNNYIEVEAMGLPKKTDTKIGQKKVHARKSAILNGYVALIAEAKEVAVEASQANEDEEFASSSAQARLNGAVRGAKIIKENWNPDEEIYTVTLRMPIHGVGSIASAVTPKHETKQAFYNPAEYAKDKGLAKTGNVNFATNGHYTGVVVDCRGLNIKKAMSPVIADETKSPIYGYKNLDYDYVVSNGMVGYSNDISNVPRAGSNPMVIKAIGVKGNSSPIISNIDANNMLAENEVTHFLDTTNVVFVL